MTILSLPEPDWERLPGGSGEAAWIVDRDRKVSIAAEIAADVLRTRDRLADKGSLFICTPEALRNDAFSVVWYVSLAGFSMKTLSNISERPKAHGLNRKVRGLVQKLESGNIDRVVEEQLRAFSDWINSEIESLFPEGSRDPDIAVAMVLLILGGRVIGRGQNICGDDAVILVKTQLAPVLEQFGCVVEVRAADGKWLPHGPTSGLTESQYIRVNGSVSVEFLGGGDRPDAVARRGEEVLFVAEIKGRKDLSNVWESWMPQVADHMRTWAQAFPDAARLFFGTQVTSEMIVGESVRGTTRSGLRQLYKDGHLSGVYNLSKIAEGDRSCSLALRALGEQIAQLAG